jgi:hypothetical protein
MLLKKELEDLQQIMLNYGPSFLKKKPNKTIGPRGLVNCNFMDDSKHFILGEHFFQMR